MVLMLFALMPSRIIAQQIWGVTKNGGANGTGVIYKTDASGGTFVLHSSLSPQNKTGKTAVGQLMLASDGMIYGVTQSGGNENNGTLYQINPATNAFTKKFDFPRIPGAGGQPGGNPVQIGTKLYVVSPAEGANALGALWEYNMTTGTNTLVYNFQLYPNPGYPTPVIVAVNNKIYGKSLGGLNNKGTIWEYDPATSTFTKKIDFDTFSSMSSTSSSLIVGPGSKIYFSAWYAGQYFMYEYVPGSTTITQKYNFGSYGLGGQLALSSTGKIYGVIGLGGGLTGIGEYNVAANTYALKHTFGTAAAEGSSHADFWFKPGDDDMLYGTASGGGTNDKGIIFEYKISTNTLTKYESSDFARPQPGLCWHAGTGKFFGATYDASLNGGTSNLFTYVPVNGGTPASGNKIYQFVQSGGAANFGAGLLKSPDGNYYGQTSSGGYDNVGTVVKANLFTSGQIDSFNQMEFSYFDNPTLGAFPEGGTTLFTNNKMYGITSQRGTYGFGGIYEHDTWLSPQFHFQYDHAVPGSQNGLTLANAKFFGMMAKWNAATAPDGIIYDYVSGTLTVRYTFTPATGTKPMGKLLLASNGLLYGVTSTGGANNNGVLFEFNPTTYAYTKRYDFNSSVSGSTPIGDLIQVASSGKLYGMTSAGGANGVGTIYEFDPATNTFTKKHDFVAANGSTPIGAFVCAPNGNLYGTTSVGGSSNLGVFFEYNLSTSTFTKKFDFTGANGANPTGALWYDPNFSKYPQSIDFPAIPAGKRFGDPPFTLTATASSGLPVSFSSFSSSTLSVSGNTATILAPGEGSVGANQAGNATYFAAPTVARNFTIGKALQTITFPQPANQCSYGDITLGATSTSNLAVTYESSNPGYLSINGNVAHINGTLGATVTITAKQAGNQTYEVATDVQRTITLYALPTPTITPPTKVCLGAPAPFSTEAGMTNYVWSSPEGTVQSGQGTMTANISWPTSGNFKTVRVTYKNANGCSPINPTSYNNVSVSTLPVTNISGATTGCAGTNVAVSSTGFGDTYLWNPIGGTVQSGQGTMNANVRWSTAGTKTVQLTITYQGCTQSPPASRTITVTSVSAGINAPNGTNVCNAVVVLSATPSGSTYLWSTGETSQSIYAYDKGSYSVTVTKSGCSSSASISVTRSPNNCPLPRIAAPDTEEPQGSGIVTAIADDQPLLNGEIGVSPVPADRHLIIDFPAGKGTAVIQLQDVTGRVFNRETILNATRKELDVAQRSNGLYILTIETPTRRIVRKVLIQH